MNKIVTTGRIDSCKIVELIEVQFLRGTGVEADPMRRVTAWFTEDGEKIYELDSLHTTPPERLREALVGIEGLLERFDEQAVLIRDGDLVEGAQPHCAIRKAAIAYRLAKEALV